MICCYFNLCLFNCVTICKVKHFFISYINYYIFHFSQYGCVLVCLGQSRVASKEDIFMPIALVWRLKVTLKYTNLVDKWYGYITLLSLICSYLLLLFLWYFFSLFVGIVLEYRYQRLCLDDEKSSSTTLSLFQLC